MGRRGLHYHHKALVLAHEEATVRIVALLCRSTLQSLGIVWGVFCNGNGLVNAYFMVGLLLLFFLGVGAVEN